MSLLPNVTTAQWLSGSSEIAVRPASTESCGEEHSQYRISSGVNLRTNICEPTRSHLQLLTRTQLRLLTRTQLRRNSNLTAEPAILRTSRTVNPEVAES